MKFSKENCPYCHEDNQGQTKVINKGYEAVYVNVREQTLELAYDGSNGRINFCPVCGRRLDRAT